MKVQKGSLEMKYPSFTLFASFAISRIQLIYLFERQSDRTRIYWFISLSATDSSPKTPSANAGPFAGAQA